MQQVVAYRDSSDKKKKSKEVRNLLNEIERYGKWNAVDEDEKILANVIIRTFDYLGETCTKRDISLCIDDQLNSAIRHQGSTSPKIFKLFSEAR